MLTVLLYVVVMVVVGAVLFVAASAVFGRGEVLAPIPPGTTATVLPATDVTGAEVRDLRFQQVLRGYKTSEVDWALDRLAREIDGLRTRLAEYEGTGYVADDETAAEAGTGDDAAVGIVNEPVGDNPEPEPAAETVHPEIANAEAETEAIAADAVAARAANAEAETEAIATDAVAARAEKARAEAERSGTSGQPGSEGSEPGEKL